MLIAFALSFYMYYNKNVEGSREVKNEPYGQKDCFAPETATNCHL